MKLSKEEKEVLIHKVENYFLNERGEEIGSLAAMLFVDYITNEIGPVFYNKGIEAAHDYFEEKIEDVYGLKKTITTK
ncbi:MAG: DUF2164 domain-containing protein [Bacillaceae bacterium]